MLLDDNKNRYPNSIDNKIKNVFELASRI